jgi:hypothetical protein
MPSTQLQDALHFCLSLVLGRELSQKKSVNSFAGENNERLVGMILLALKTMTI